MKLFIILIFTFGLAHSQTIKKYDIKVSGLKVGTLVAKEFKLDGFYKKITLESNTQMNLILFKLKVYYKVESVYFNNRLMSSKVVSKTNKGEFDANTLFVNNDYHVSAHHHKKNIKKTISGGIDFTVANLFFEEPHQQKTAYAEFYTDFFKIRNTKEGVYELKSANSEDTYFYKENKLYKIIKHNPINNFEIILSD